MGLRKCVDDKGRAHWLVDLRRRGQPRVRETYYGTKRLAQERHDIIENLVLSGEWFQKKTDGLLFKDFYRQYWEKHVVMHLKKKTQNNYELWFRSPLKFFGNKPLTGITSDDIDNFKAKRVEDFATREAEGETTINRELGAMRGLFGFAMKKKLIKRNPTTGVERFKERTRKASLDIEELNALLEAAKEERHVHLLITMGLCTGMRRGEMLNLRWGRVDFRKRVIVLTETKTEPRRVPMNRTLTETLLTYKEEQYPGNVEPHKEAFVFKNPQTGKPFTDMKRSFKTAWQKAGLEYFWVHGMRHVWTNWMYKKKVNPLLVRTIGGWSTRGDAHAGYFHPDDEDMLEAVERLDDLFEGEGARIGPSYSTERLASV